MYSLVRPKKKKGHAPKCSALIDRQWFCLSSGGAKWVRVESVDAAPLRQRIKLMLKIGRAFRIFHNGSNFSISSLRPIRDFGELKKKAKVRVTEPERLRVSAALSLQP